MSEQSQLGASGVAGAEANAGMWIDAEAYSLPYFDFEVQQKIAWRLDDIVISVPVKCGTTWTMNIVHQLRSGGDPDFDDVYVEVPWLELLPSRDISQADFINQIDSMRTDRPRAFKTHCGPGPLPVHPAASGKGVRYVVIVRNPDEVIGSMWPFFQSISSDFYEYWGIDETPFRPADMATFYELFSKTMLPDGLFGFTAAWWKLRHEPNVMLLHFSDMKRDHEGSVRKIADFLGFTPTAEQWPAILEYTSFPWMKKHEDKFEARLASAVPVLTPGGMMRKGKTGAAKEDGVTPAMSEELRSLGAQLLTDERAMRWLYEGGSLD